MAIPRAMRPFVTHVFNPFARQFAGHLPYFAILRHTGRTSGRTYDTPINVFHHEGRYVFALTYGPDTQWVKNVVAADGADLVERGRLVHLAHPHLFTDAKGRKVPRLVAFFLRLVGVSGFLEMEPVP